MNRTKRMVVYNYFVGDIDNTDSHTGYKTLADVREQFKKKGCEVLTAQIKGKNAILVVSDNSIIIYRYKLV